MESPGLRMSIGESRLMLIGESRLMNWTSLGLRIPNEVSRLENLG